MPFDGTFKIRSLTCGPHPTFMEVHLLSEIDEYRTEALLSFISMSIEGGMLFLEDTVLIGGAFGNEIVCIREISKQDKSAAILLLRRLLHISEVNTIKLSVEQIAV